MEWTTLLLAVLALLFVGVLLFLCVNRRGSWAPPGVSPGAPGPVSKKGALSRADELRIKQALLDATATGAFCGQDASAPGRVARELAEAFSVLADFAARDTGS